MDDILSKLAECIEKGKADINSSYPPEMKDEEGASELTKKALQMNISPNDILTKSLMVGMSKIGEQFSQGKAFIPNLLISAKAMNASMAHLKPFFDKGEVVHKGTLVIGTVSGDLHDIGKNLVKMVMEGDAWKVIDLGTDVSAEKFSAAVEENPECVVGLSALLTTTMLNMEDVIKSVKKINENTKVFVGGAPLSQEFSDKIGADGYFPDPHGLAEYLN